MSFSTGHYGLYIIAEEALLDTTVPAVSITSMYAFLDVQRGRVYVA